MTADPAAHAAAAAAIDAWRVGTGQPNLDDVVAAIVEDATTRARGMLMAELAPSLAEVVDLIERYEADVAGRTQQAVEESARVRARAHRTIDETVDRMLHPPKAQPMVQTDDWPTIATAAPAEPQSPAPAPLSPLDMLARLRDRGPRT